MSFAGLMIDHPPPSPFYVGNKTGDKPIRFGWDGDTIPVYSYKEYDSYPLQNSGFKYTTI